MNTRQVGDYNEARVCRALEKYGYTILERNYRVRQGEIDIVANDGEYLAFVEVKYRRAANAGDGFDAVDYRKQRQISKVAKFYMYSHGISLDCPIRFDVVSCGDNEIKLLKNAFDYIER